MKRFRTVFTVTLFAAGVLAGCNDYNSSIQTPTGASLIAISPSGILAGTPSNPTQCTDSITNQTFACFVLTAQGSITNPFGTNSVIQWNGQKLHTTYIDSVDISAQVPYTLVAKPGSAAIEVYAPQSGSGRNGLSNTISFHIYGAPNPVPTLTSISPTSTAVCTGSKCADVPITITGTNFLPTSTNGNSIVTFTGIATTQIETTINATSITSTSIKATIPGKYLGTADGSVKINVKNPPSFPGCYQICGGGDTNDPSAGPVTTQLFQITGTGAASATSTALAVAEEAPAVSQDGRYVAYASAQGEIAQILLRDTCVGAASGCAPSTRVISAAVDGTAGNADSHNAAMTSDGRYVAFSSAATNLADNAPTGRQVYLYDSCLGATGVCKPSTVLVSTDTEGKLAGTEAILPSVSSSGRFVAFLTVTPSAATPAASGSSATAVAAPNSGLRQVFVRDTCLGVANCTPKTTRISLQPGEAPVDSAKPAGPALAGLAKQIALSDGKTSTVFTPTVPVDDRVFLAIPSEVK